MPEVRHLRFFRPAARSLIVAIACLASVGCGTSEPAVPVLESKGSKEDVSKSIDNPLGADLKDPAGKKAASRPSK